MTTPPATTPSAAIDRSHARTAAGLNAVDAGEQGFLRRLGERLRWRWRRNCRRLGPPFRPNLWRVQPVSREFGFDRGLPVDRHYIEAFLARNAEVVRGAVLEVEHDVYARRFGGGRVTAVDILYAMPGHDQATVVADLTDAPQIPDDRYDCIILVHTLQYIFDVPAAVRTLHRILKPGGHVLAAVPFIEQYNETDRRLWGEYWLFSKSAALRLFAAAFGEANVRVSAYGNALACCAFLMGIAAEELSADELGFYDDQYDLIVAVCARKA